MALEQTIGFLGAGKMATALAKGFVQANLVSPTQVVASDPVQAARQFFSRQSGGQILGSNVEVVQASQMVVLAVKPDQVPGVLEGIKGTFTSKHLLISVAAGIPLARLEGFLLGDGLEREARVVRVMPNAPALVGASATAYALGQAAHKGDGDLVQKLFSSIGLTFRVSEPLLDAVTGLSGSGPAFVFLVIEALSDGGVAAGLPRDVATRLAAQTLLGSAKLLLETGLHPGALKDMVTSPGGTTIEGVHQLEQGGVRGALINAVRAATEKSKKLGAG
jgi:pyrroline-5-carboxylate reductase